MKRSIALLLAAAANMPAQAQLTAPVKNGDTTIVVTGTKPDKGKPVEMSDWRMAETPHVVVFSKGGEKDLIRIAHNLEKLHFLLSALTGRDDDPDETIKIAVTMIEDAGGFEQLRLTDLRWQYGPFPPQFEKTIYYDPREEGPVLASTNAGVNLTLIPSKGRPTSRNCAAGDHDRPLVGNLVDSGPVALPGASAMNSRGDIADTFELNKILTQLPLNEVAFCQSAESRLYAGFAQNYLMTYFPAAYPRWYVQGFGEMFATMEAGDNYVEYGQLPPGFFRVMEEFGDYPVANLFNGRYLTGKGRTWTPYDAWRLVNLLYFSEEWKPKLRTYLAAIARGEDSKSAARAFGDSGALQRAVIAYRGRKMKSERATFPADRAPAPIVRRLTRAEAGLIRGRLELGARVELPPEGGPDRPRALARREAWLARLRDNAARFPNLIENQLLLAEGECRSGNSEACLQAAERALALGESDTTALVWKGTAMLQLAARAPASERKSRIRAARAVIAKANAADPKAILPLIAFSNSFAAVGERAPDIAVDALFTVVDYAPAAPRPRLLLGGELVSRDLDAEARKALLPVAKGPFDSPEKPRAEAILPRPASRSAR